MNTRLLVFFSILLLVAGLMGGSVILANANAAHGPVQVLKPAPAVPASSVSIASEWQTSEAPEALAEAAAEPGDVIAVVEEPRVVLGTPYERYLMDQIVQLQRENANLRQERDEAVMALDPTAFPTLYAEFLRSDEAQMFPTDELREWVRDFMICWPIHYRTGEMVWFYEALGDDRWKQHGPTEFEAAATIIGVNRLLFELPEADLADFRLRYYPE